MAVKFTDAWFISLTCLIALLGSAAGQIQYFPPKCATVCRSPSQFQPGLPAKPVGDENRVSQWGIVALNQIKANLGTTSPPGVGRALGVFSSCINDAISLFDPRLTPLAATAMPKLGVKVPNMLEDAIDGAAYAALMTIFAGKPSLSMVREFMDSIAAKDTGGTVRAFVLVFTIDPKKFNNVFTIDLRQLLGGTMDKKMAMEAGAMACQKVVEKFTADGYDSLGNPLPGTPDFPFTPANLPQTRAGITNCPVEMMDLNKWQPLCSPTVSAPLVNLGTTDCTAQSYLAASAGGWTTFGLPAGTPNDGQILVDAIKKVNAKVQGGPPQIEVGTAWEDQWKEVIQFSGDLDDPLKLVAEFWADGPDSTAPPGTWYLISIRAAETRRLSLTQTARLLFIVGNALNDAGVAAWRLKVTFDSIRPLQMVQCGSVGSVGGDVTGWRGPYMGVGPVPASTWQPFQLDTFKTPPFSGYVSGHSTFSTAASESLNLFFGGTAYSGPNCVRFEEGESTFEQRILPGEPGFRAGITDVPNTGKTTVGYSPNSPVVLCWDTFDEAADQASESRIYGGIHVRADAVDGEILGQEIGKAAYARVMRMARRKVDIVTAF